METVSVILVVMGLTQWVKEKAGLKGAAAEVAVFVIGLALGVGVQLASVPALPLDFPGWFRVVVFGLAMGLVPSGLYKFATEFKPG